MASMEDLQRFVASVAARPKDGDLVNGEPLEMENDEIFSAYYAVISEARGLLGIKDSED